MHAAPQTGGSVHGRVLDALGGEALARVRVELAQTGAERTTDSAGVFHFDGLAPGDYTIQVSTVGYRMLRRSFLLVAGESKEFEVVLSPESLRHTETVEVTSGPFDVPRHDSPSEITLSPSEVKNLGSVLADDPLRAVQAMPGVTSNNDFDSRFSMRGSSYQRIGLYFDALASGYNSHRFNWLEIASDGSWDSTSSKACKMGTCSNSVRLSTCRIS